MQDGRLFPEGTLGQERADSHLRFREEVGEFLRCERPDHNQRLFQALASLRALLTSFDFVRIKPDKEYLTIQLPGAACRAERVEPATGKLLASSMIESEGGPKKLASPRFAVDVALRVRRVATE